MLSDLPPQTDPGVLIDFRTSDDAGVYRWPGTGPALVQTVDFFTPIVDDPFTYGQIAAANSLSDVYAMGGTPVTALAIAGFPDKVLDAETIKQIFLGGYDKLREAGVALLGGHTVRDPEVKFGYAVTGAVDPDRIWANAGARAGDRLILTKWLGTGIVGTAIKKGHAPDALVAHAVASMTMLNKAGADVLRQFAGAVHGATDITGFGLIGHATEMARASGVSIAIDTARLPLLPGVTAIASQNRSGGMGTNREHFEDGVEAGHCRGRDRSTSATTRRLRAACWYRWTLRTSRRSSPSWQDAAFLRQSWVTSRCRAPTPSPCRRPNTANSDSFERAASAIVRDVAGVDRSCRLEQQHRHFLVGHRTMLHAARHDEELARARATPADRGSPCGIAPRRRETARPRRRGDARRTLPGTSRA